MAKKILIANRGQIACRIALSCKRLGIETVGIYSPADSRARHTRVVDVAVALPGDTLATTYLDLKQIVKIAKEHGCFAIHPGYGFLSENASFAREIIKNDLLFIGPRPETIEIFGDKIRAKELATKAGVPVLESLTIDPKDLKNKELDRFIAANPFPLLVKAAGGGGGRGMKLVEKREDLEQAVHAASREASTYFSDPKVFLERYLPEAKHIEVQIVGDLKGQVRTLFERECSFQRNHQKVIEEAPAAGLSPQSQTLMLEAALNLGREAKYLNLGTVEFLLSKGGEFFFLEANSRLQVEHPVTEAITGIDLVTLQIKLAEGQSLEDLLGEANTLGPHGHAIECRLCAEDPYNNFQAGTGKVLLSNLTELADQFDWVRIDAGYESGDLVSPEYDSLFAKLIVHGRDRAEAISRLEQALGAIHLLGISNNSGLLQVLVGSKEFKDGSYHVQTLPSLMPDPKSIELLRIYAAAIAYLEGIYLSDSFGEPFRLFGSARQLKSYSVNGDRVDLEVKLSSLDSLVVTGAGLDAGGVLLERQSRDSRISYLINSARFAASVYYYDHATLGINLAHLGAAMVRETPISMRQDQAERGSLEELRSPLPGKILKVNAIAGKQVTKGDTLVVLESMKMEHPLKAVSDATVLEVLGKEGEIVDSGLPLIRFQAE